MKETKYAGTQTEKNLMAAFAGESEARNKYTYFASKAKKEGFEQIAALFLLGLGCKIRNTPKYSLQGTTQGRYLTGGVPPIRFSM